MRRGIVWCCVWATDVRDCTDQGGRDRAWIGPGGPGARVGAAGCGAGMEVELHSSTQPESRTWLPGRSLTDNRKRIAILAPLSFIARVRRGVAVSETDLVPTGRDVARRPVTLGDGDDNDETFAAGARQWRMGTTTLADGSASASLAFAEDDLVGTHGPRRPCRPPGRPRRPALLDWPRSVSPHWARLRERPILRIVGVDAEDLTSTSSPGLTMSRGFSTLGRPARRCAADPRGPARARRRRRSW
jgi:hypothetical protein